MPDTPELRAYFGYPPGQQPGCGFPVGHLLALFHAGTGFLLKVVATPGHTHDMAHARQVHTALQPGDVLVADRGFCSFAHLALLHQQHLHAVMRVHHKQLVDFTPSRPHKVVTPARARKGVPRSRWLRQLGGLDQLVAWVKPVQRPPWMTADQFAALPQELCVRELQYLIGQPGFRTRTVTLGTTLLAADQYPVEALAALYRQRWQVEISQPYYDSSERLYLAAA
jgi:Transposase DDE domain